MHIPYLQLIELVISGFISFIITKFVFSKPSPGEFILCFLGFLVITILVVFLLILIAGLFIIAFNKNPA